MSQTTAWNPDSYSKNARFVSDLGEPLLQLLDPKPGELILDLGCGDGALTERIKAARSTVIGVDSSVALLKAARARDLSVALMDGHQLALKRRFDGVFTNAALHWMKRPEWVVEGVANCLKPGGRFVGEFGGKGNVATIRTALHVGLRRRDIDPWSVDPWYYPSAEEYSKLLIQFGFTVDSIELIPRPTKLPGDIHMWLEIFAEPFTNSLKESERENFLQEVKNSVEQALRHSDGSWFADYVRLRFKAVAGLRTARLERGQTV
jgi:trans-aconitate methyltransferase